MKYGLWVESKVASFLIFSEIWLIGYFRYGKGYKIGPTGLEPPAGARLGEKLL